MSRRAATCGRGATRWIRLQALALCGAALLASRPAAAQLSWPEVTPGVEVGIGHTLLSWEEDISRVSYLPALSLAGVLPIHLDSTITVQPLAGLQFDAVSFKTERIDYADHYTVTSVRAGLLLLAADDHVVAGFGPMWQRPIWVRASVKSRTPDGRDWVVFADPDVLREAAFYWLVRLGFVRSWGYFSFDLAFDNGGGAFLARLFPNNPLTYRSIRLNVHVPLSTFGL